MRVKVSHNTCLVTVPLRSLQCLLCPSSWYRTGLWSLRSSSWAGTYLLGFAGLLVIQSQGLFSPVHTSVPKLFFLIYLLLRSNFVKGNFRSPEGSSFFFLFVSIKKKIEWVGGNTKWWKWIWSPLGYLNYHLLYTRILWALQKANSF